MRRPTSCAIPFRRRREMARDGGFTLVELIFLLLLIITLATVLIPIYTSVIDKARGYQAAAEIRTLEQEIMMFELNKGSLPRTLAEVGRGDPQDPWGNDYHYVRIAAVAPDAVRTDRFLVPLNADYDLYSTGKDGASRPPLGDEASWDDIVRANNGEYVGPAAEY